MKHLLLLFVFFFSSLVNAKVGQPQPQPKGDCHANAEEFAQQLNKLHQIGYDKYTAMSMIDTDDQDVARVAKAYLNIVYSANWLILDYDSFAYHFSNGVCGKK
jgi:hypothetical protein